MRVKRLEIQGFKSFKDKTVIHFDHSITGIVGPNGCGKSNIVDAFFWVMGEQSYKHMRGSGSDDLIFNGSSKYSPLGLAEATMVLETGYTEDSTRDIPAYLKSKEISVTRRLYRSGEGEYLINGIPARLKDIKELFMDTGVGAKGYSVIEQGQIGKIVNAKPEERRLLIEEAAGIAKYKARKAESLRKMDAAKANLERLADIIAEIERQVQSLDRQAQKARLYRKHKDELTDKEMTWGRRKLTLLNLKIEGLLAKRQGLEQELAAFKTELHTAENNTEVDRLAQLQDSKSLEEFQNNLRDFEQELTRKQSSLELSQKRQGDLSAQLQKLDLEKEETRAAIAYAQEEIQAFESRVESSKGEFEQATAKTRELETQALSLRATLDDLRKKLELNRKELLNSIQGSSDLNSRVASLESRADSQRQHAERLLAQIQSQTLKIVALGQELGALEIASGDSLAAKTSKEQVLATQTQELIQLEQTFKALESASNQKDHELTTVQVKLAQLEELDRAHEGFSDGTRFALETIKANGGAERVQAIADCVQVTSGFEATLEGWLESKLENLVTEDAGLAFDSIKNVVEAKHGRVHVRLGNLHSDSVPDQSYGQVRDTLVEKGFQVLGPLTEFVKTQDTSVLELLRQVVVVESLEPLAVLLKSDEHKSDMHWPRWGIVSRSGMAFEADGLLRGGLLSSELDGGQSLSVLMRKRALEDLRSDLARIEAQAKELLSQKASLASQIESAREQAQAIKQEIQTIDLSAARLDRDLILAKKSLTEAQGSLSTLEASLADSNLIVEQAIEEREHTLEARAALDLKKTELEAVISTYELEIQTQDQRVIEQESLLGLARVTETELRERASASQREIDALRRSLAEKQRRLDVIEASYAQAQTEYSGFAGSDQELQDAISVLTSRGMDLRQSVGELKDRLEQTTARLNLAHERIKELHKTGNDKSAESNLLQVEEERLRAELGFHVQNLEEKYGQGCLTQPSFVGEPGNQESFDNPIVTQEMSAEEELLLNEEVERLRERIRRLGEVNPSAVEEYDAAKQRFDHLIGERTDLELSIKNLEEAIEHINKTSEERFRKAFTAIADRFERLFPVIFGGGSASLTLIYPEGSTDILEAGVDIMAQPPGKKVSNITLLSGGEKALTAVSLIFAIFMVKPSPFCVLDEVDAPLDDANIGKFNALLKEMSVKSQFILITHNKKTMELNDTLYGVTMEEPGVSKMVSIELH